jgi:hypothetical protein
MLQGIFAHNPPIEKVQVSPLDLDETTMDSNTRFVLQYIVGSKLLFCVFTIILYERSPFVNTNVYSVFNARLDKIFSTYSEGYTRGVYEIYSSLRLSVLFIQSDLSITVR